MQHVPRQAGPGEAQVRVHAVGISRSDRDVYLGRRPVPYVRYPVTPGHEWSGTVTAVGEGAPAPLLGRKVVGEGLRTCGTCAPCRDGETDLCTLGYEETGFTLPGAMAPTRVLPARLLHTLAPDADLTAAAFLEPAGIPVQGAERLDPAQVVARQLSIGTAFGPSSGAWSYAVSAFSAGRLTPLELLTHQLGIDEFERAMELTGSGDPRVGRVLLRP
ncbi:alcohol dehydrogenase catalytic domain-containing protein [Streptomyces sp. NPDC042898]|uniref:alcohol dehydrogenase catalytic domain-containing protein n=1 Tax=Streptomyces sp. NPDC042898 TaxID=3154334 RepID=UPI0033CBF55F